MSGRTVRLTTPKWSRTIETLQESALKLSDKRFPAGGSGRAGSGNFVLSELEVTAGPVKDYSKWDRTKEWRFDDPLAEEIGWSGSNGAQLKLLGKVFVLTEVRPRGHPTRRLAPR